MTYKPSTYHLYHHHLPAALLCLALVWFAQFGPCLAKVGYPARCALNRDENNCIDDVSCYWCSPLGGGGGGSCLGKWKVLSNNTYYLASCNIIKNSHHDRCSETPCQNCMGTECLYKECGIPDGSINGLPTEDTCDAAAASCFWCITLEGQGQCSPKLSDCTEIRNDHLGICKSIDCVNDYQYDGMLLELTQKKVVIGVKIFAGWLSFFGSLFIIVSIVYFKRYRFMSSRLILSLGVCSLIESVNSLFSMWLFHDELELWGFCIFQGVLHQFASIGTTGWVTVIAINLYLVVCRNILNKRLEYLYHVVVWVVALLSALLPLSSKNAYGIAGLWCWLSWDSGQMWRWLSYYLPLILSSLIILILYILIILHVRKHTPTDDKDEEDEEDDEVEEEDDIVDTSDSDAEVKRRVKPPSKPKLKMRKSSIATKDASVYVLRKLSFYPFIHLLTYIGSVINRFYDALSIHDSFFLYVLEAATLPLNGFLWGVGFWVWDREVRLAWRALCKRRVCTGSRGGTEGHWEDEEEGGEEDFEECHFKKDEDAEDIIQ